MKKKSRKQPGPRFKAVYIFGAVIFFITLFTVFGDKGLIDVYRIKKDRNNISKYNSALKKENAGLEIKIALLKKDPRYIAEIAKKELGMIRKDEVVYRFETLD